MKCAVVQFDIDMSLYQGGATASKLRPTQKFVAECSRESFEKYCEKYGHDYHLVTEPKLMPMHPTWERVSLWFDDWFDEYDMVCYADTDVFAMPWAPDIFELCLSDSFNRPPYAKLERKPVADHPIWEELGIKAVRAKGFQAGVWVLTRQSRDDTLELVKDYENEKFEDDSYFLNYAVIKSGTPVHSLPKEFNVKWSPLNGFSGAYFSHAFGNAKYSDPGILKHQLRGVGLCVR